MKCNVCKEGEAVSVNCSATGAMSFAYCEACLRSGREPYGAVVASLFGMSSMEDVAEWYRPIIRITLKAEGKSVEELFADVTSSVRVRYITGSTQMIPRKGRRLSY